MFGYQPYPVYIERRPIKGAIILTWILAGAGSSALGNGAASILPVLAAVAVTVAIVWSRRAAERAHAEEQWRYQKDWADYQAAAFERAWHEGFSQAGGPHSPS